MQAVINAVNIVLSIFILIGTGMYLTWRNRLNDQNASLISHLVVRVALPGTIISNLFGSFTSESMKQCLQGLVAPVLRIPVLLLPVFQSLKFPGFQCLLFFLLMLLQDC